MRSSGVDDDSSAGDCLAGRWSLLASAIERLGGARTLEEITSILRGSARGIAGADGIAIVLRDGDLCHYVAEDAMAPLWSPTRPTTSPPSRYSLISLPLAVSFSPVLAPSALMASA